MERPVTNFTKDWEDYAKILEDKLVNAEFLIKAARCPACDGSGAVDIGDPKGCDWEMCQWCYTKAKNFPDEGDDKWGNPVEDEDEYDLPF